MVKSLDQAKIILERRFNNLVKQIYYIFARHTLYQIKTRRDLQESLDIIIEGRLFFFTLESPFLFQYCHQYLFPCISALLFIRMISTISNDMPWQLSYALLSTY